MAPGWEGSIIGTYQMLVDVFKTQVFASIPEEHKADFRATLYGHNLSRFAAQCIVLVAMDTISLLAYLFYYLGTGPFLPVHIAVHIAKILLMTFLFFRYALRKRRPYNDARFFDRYANLVFPATHAAGEIALYVTGPQDLGAFIRFMAVPFIIGSITILQQQQVYVLDALFYLFYTFYLPYGTPYDETFILPAFLVNLWPVVFLCAVLVSNIIYSAYVNTYLRGVSEQAVQKELKQLNARLDILSRRDQLTGLSNRRDYEQYMGLTWDEERARQDTATFMMLDIDHFKHYNDRFGHMAGDECLVNTTKVVRECLMGTDHMFARYGGEEFLLVFYGYAHAEMVQLAERIRFAVERLKIENPDSNASPYLTISIGLATIPTAEVMDHSELVRIADECLYFAKQNGRNRVVQLDYATRRYCDVAGNSLQREPTATVVAPPRHHDADHLNRAIREVNLDCTLLYSRNEDLIVFSPHAQDVLGTPSRITQPTVEKILGMLPLAQEENAHLLELLQQNFAEQQPDIELELCLQSGVDKNWVAARLHCLYGPDGPIVSCAGSFFLIQNVLAYSSYSYEKAMVSAITLLPNRKRFYTDMEAALAAGMPGALVLFDIDNFKSINSIFSHSIGDKVLRKVGTLIAKMAAGDANVYHYTTDQYILMLESTSKSFVQGLVERILHFFSTYDITIEGVAMRIPFYVGAVEYTGTGEMLDDLLVNLDIALQKAKLQHHRGFCIFSEDDKAEYIARMALEKEVVYATEHEFTGFTLFYQPLFCSQTHRCMGCEALLRFATRDGRPVPPLTVVSILEKQGLISAAGRWILHAACAQCRSWIDAGASEDFYVHVNMSVFQFDKMDFVSEVLETLAEHGLGPNNLVLEVTEGSLMSETGLTVAILRALRTAGVRVAVDDFGTGYSSLSYLRNLPADEIKIDKSFLQDIETDESAQRVLRSIASLTKGMGYLVCMEGAETEAHMEFLKDSPIDLLQGYLLGRPVPADTFRQQWIDKK
ncbi:diguanylate cyclase [Ruminococcaceae bacterium OttesenSCG-928-O06]|nr:diguanylate cyclase [Ruminococcaceae bacterium OttesenSCG-928-O06]